MKKATRRIRGGKSDSEERFRSACSHVRYTLRRVGDLLKKKASYEDLKNANGIGVSLYGDLSELLRISAKWRVPDEAYTLPIYDALDQAHKDTFGDNRKWNRESASREVDATIKKLLTKLRCNKFCFDVADKAREENIPGKVSVMIYPEPALPSAHEMFAFLVFLEEASRRLKVWIARTE